MQHNPIIITRNVYEKFYVSLFGFITEEFVNFQLTKEIAKRRRFKNGFMDILTFMIYSIE